MQKTKGMHASKTISSLSIEGGADAWFDGNNKEDNKSSYRGARGQVMLAQHCWGT